MRKSKELIVFLLSCYILVGCTNEKITKINGLIDKENVSITEAVNQELPDNEVKQKSNDLNSLDIWVGNYTFNEYAPPDENMYYSIVIYMEDNVYYADISIDGFQTMSRYKAKIAGNDKKIDIIFDSYLPDNLYDPYIEGDVLLSLTISDLEIYTSWGKLQPMLQSNIKSGQIYFEYDKAK